jgi:hypothetical protein
MAHRLARRVEQLEGLIMSDSLGTMWIKAAMPEDAGGVSSREMAVAKIDAAFRELMEPYKRDMNMNLYIEAMTSMSTALEIAAWYEPPLDD